MTPTRALTLALFLLTAPGLGCNDGNLQDRGQCDGVLNTVEQTVDDGFDQDGDGYFDANSTACQGTYDAEQLDCNDDDSGVNPGAAESVCNDLDDDCDPDTLDAPDADGDGASPCDGDCDDDQPLVGPDELEELCDGLDNDCDPSSPDGLDEDGDGYTTCDDCDDTNDAVNPATAEVTCNGLDDDCNLVTPDGDDFDNDGVVHCFDCDDADPLRYPGNAEICEDGIDQNCDTVDPDCPPPTWDGIWSTDSAVSYSCAQNSVVINFSSFSIIDSTPSISFTFIGGSQPGTISGTVGSAAPFAVNATYTISGLCDEVYSLSGNFTDGTTFVGTFDADFIDTTGTGIACFGCTSQSWAITGTR